MCVYIYIYKGFEACATHGRCVWDLWYASRESTPFLYSVKKKKTQDIHCVCLQISSGCWLCDAYVIPRYAGVHVVRVNGRVRTCPSHTHCCRCMQTQLRLQLGICTPRALLVGPLLLLFNSAVFHPSPDWQLGDGVTVEAWHCAFECTVAAEPYVTCLWHCTRVASTIMDNSIELQCGFSLTAVSAVWGCFLRNPHLSWVQPGHACCGSSVGVAWLQQPTASSFCAGRKHVTLQA